MAVLGLRESQEIHRVRNLKVLTQDSSDTGARDRPILTGQALGSASKFLVKAFSVSAPARIVDRTAVPQPP